MLEEWKPLGMVGKQREMVFFGSWKEHSLIWAIVMQREVIRFNPLCQDSRMSRMMLSPAPASQVSSKPLMAHGLSCDFWTRFSRLWRPCQAGSQREAMTAWFYRMFFAQPLFGILRSTIWTRTRSFSLSAAELKPIAKDGTKDVTARNNHLRLFCSESS